MKTSPRLSLAVAGAAAVTATLLPIPTAHAAPAPSVGKVVAAAKCVASHARHGGGECVEYRVDGHTEHMWLGTYRDAHGRVFFCTDLGYSGDIAASTITSMAGIRNANGVLVDAATARALSYLVARMGPTGQSTHATVNAAMELLVRAAMADTNGRAGALTASADYTPPTWVPAPIAAQARALWAQARAHVGPYRVTLSGIGAAVEPGGIYTLTARLVSAAGQPIAGYPLTITGEGFTIAGPNHATTSASGAIAVQVRIGTNATAVHLAARATALPGEFANLAVPAGWRAHAAHTRVGQRGLVATTGTATATTAMSVVVYRPGLATQAFTHALVQGDVLTDTVQPRGILTRDAAGTPITNTLTGRILAAPGAGTCTGVDWSRARVVGTIPATPVTSNQPLTGVGRHVVSPSEIGQCLTYEETLTSTIGGRTITTRSLAGQPVESAYFNRKVTFAWEKDVWRMATPQALTAARGLLTSHVFLWRADVTVRHGHVIAPLWDKPVHISSSEGSATITVPGNATAAQIRAAEDQVVAQHTGTTAGHLAVPTRLGQTVTIGWLIQGPGTNNNPLGSWHKGTTAAQGPHTLPQLEIGTTIR